MIEATRVTCAKPISGIDLPPTSSATPAASATAAVAKVAMEATTPAVAPAIHSDLTRRGRSSDCVAVSAVKVVVAVMAAP